MVKNIKTIEMIAGLILVGAIVFGCWLVLRPFVSAILWAGIVCLATWPLHEILLRRLHGRRTLAAGLMTLLLTLAILIPFVIVGFTFTESIASAITWLDAQQPTDARQSLAWPPLPAQVKEIGDSNIPDSNWPPSAAGVNRVGDSNIPDSNWPPSGADMKGIGDSNIPGRSWPPPPAWLKERIPWWGLGEKISNRWISLGEDIKPTVDWLMPWFKKGGLWLLAHSLSLIKGIFYLAMSILIAFFLYRDGEGAVQRLRDAFQHISGDAASRLIDVVQATVRSVVYGVIGTAIAQGIVAYIGFRIARVPSAMLLALFTFFLSFIPIGPPVVWIGAAVWLFLQSRIGGGLFMVAYGVFCISLVDNVIKPLIISRGSKLSFIVMFIGVLGGVAAFGFIGVFLGPTLLAVGFALLQEILNSKRLKDSLGNASRPEVSASPENRQH